MRAGGGRVVSRLQRWRLLCVLDCNLTRRQISYLVNLSVRLVVGARGGDGREREQRERAARDWERKRRTTAATLRRVYGPGRWR